MATVRWGLDAAPHRKVFRELERVLKADPVLARVVKSWQTFAGEPSDLADFAIAQRPAIRLTPTEGPDQFWGPADQAGNLLVSVAVHAPGTDADDAMDLYWAVRKAVYPADDTRRVSIHRGLVVAGARAMFLVEFTHPQFKPVLEDNGPYYTAYGLIRVPVLELLNP